jgi:hypothetical protein
MDHAVSGVSSLAEALALAANLEFLLERRRSVLESPQLPENQSAATAMETWFLEEPISRDEFPFSTKCDSPLYWEIAEPGSEGKHVCHHCVAVALDGGLIAVGLESFPIL